MTTPRADAISALSWQQLQEFVEDVLRSLGFDDIQRHVRIGNVQVDLVASSTKGAALPQRLAVEVAAVRALTIAKLDAEISRSQRVLAELARRGEHAQFLLVTSGGLTRMAREAASQRPIMLWDIEELVSKTPEEVWERWTPDAAEAKRAPGEAASTTHTKGDALLDVLSCMSTGRGDAGDYQRFCADALEYLFVPPLQPVRYEHSDFDRRNRRDIILENTAPAGFWTELRRRYQADYVVVDAKNYSQKLKKRPVLEVAHYLRAYGCGLFGVILCRKGPGPAADHARRSQWIESGKMIAILGDEDLRSMIMLRRDGGAPEEVVRLHLAEFRMGL